MNHLKAKVATFGLVLLLSLALTLQAPAARRPDDRAGPRGAGPVLAQAPVRPDDRAGPRVVLGTNPSSIGRPDGRAPHRAAIPVRPDDRAGPRGPGVEPRSAALTRKQSVAVTDNGFDWMDAGVGAGGTLILLSVAAATALAHQGRSRTRHS